MNDEQLRAIVVDDEPLAREGIVRDLEALGVAIVAVCADGFSARDEIRALKPDALFLDIEMPELDGFGVLDGLEPEEMPPVVIFVTAYDQHALRAFQVNASDYLLKPLTPERLAAAVARATQRMRETRALRDITAQLEQPDTGAGSLAQLVVKDRGIVTIVSVADLEWVEAESYYVRLHARNHKPRLLRERMSVLEARLDPKAFFRTHRSAIVRLALVRSVRSLSRYESVAVLSTGAEVPVSRERRARLEELLGGSSLR